MRAIVIHAPRDLRIEERAPGQPGAGEVAVRIQAGGICGSDLHYFNHGGFGAIRIQEPMILGHEIAGRIEALGPGVTDLAVGDAVAVNPSRPCGHCGYCLEGLPNHCENMRFYGSAMRMPHIQGGFRELLVCDEGQCFKAEGVPMGELALAEPFAVTLHAIARAGDLLGKRVLVSGSGPIGALAVAAARHHGAMEIIATDIVDEPLAIVRRLGADRTINAATEGAALALLNAGKGTIDVMFECSGNAQALKAGLLALRPRGRLVQLGLGGDVPLQQNLVVSKEISFVGSFRFHAEFALAVRLIAERRVDLSPLITGTFALDEALAGFEAANDRRRSMKVQIAF